MSGKQSDLEIVKLPIDSLTPYKRNAKKHPPEQVEQIKESIRLYGNNDPIAVWGKKNMVVEGHGRFLALKELGYTEVECVRLDHLTAQERREYTLVHNQTTMNSGFDLPTLKLELTALPKFDLKGFGFDLSFPGYPESSREDLTPYRPPQEAQEDEDEPPVIAEDDYKPEPPTEAEPPRIEAQEDDYEQEPPAAPKARYGDIFQLDRHRLMCGDSANKNDMDALMQGEMSRLTVTSPPYGVGMEYEKKGIGPWKETVFGVIDTITKYTRIICWNIADLFGTGTQFIEPTSMYSTERMKENGFGLMYARIWKKNGAAFTLNPYHLVSMKPVQEYEFIFGYAKLDYEKDFAPIREYMRRQADIAGLNNKILKQITGAGFMYGHWFTPHQWDMLDESNYRKIQSYCRENGIEAFLEDYAVIRRKYDDLNIFQKTLTDDERNGWGQWAIWDITTVQKREGHPAAFPVELPARLIKMHSRENDIVLEPFGGSGTTLIACEQLGRQCRIMEREPRYVDVIIDRWEKFTGQKAVLLNP